MPPHAKTADLGRIIGKPDNGDGLRDTAVSCGIPKSSILVSDAFSKPLCSRVNALENPKSGLVN
jgi:hypothetical protein